MHGTTADLKTSVKEIKKQIERKKPTNPKCHFSLGICGVLFLDVPSCFQSPQPPTTPVFLKLRANGKQTTSTTPVGNYCLFISLVCFSLHMHMYTITVAIGKIMVFEYLIFIFLPLVTRIKPEPLECL